MQLYKRQELMAAEMLGAASTVYFNWKLLYESISNLVSINASWIGSFILAGK